jgi:hypothetical protein
MAEDVPASAITPCQASVLMITGFIDSSASFIHTSRFIHIAPRVHPMSTARLHDMKMH